MKGGQFTVVQKEIDIPMMPRGCHIITKIIIQKLPELKNFKVGSLNLFLQHTSASLTINENVCSDVRADLETWMNKAIPEGPHWEHSSEGPDDMPAHVKSSVMGVSLDIPISNGQLMLGRWQGIYLNEHRSYGGSRHIVLTITGMQQ